ncbi:MAG: flavin reductase family protein [Elusimicrobia bacterium]|nr:flavin reductase family protein [Elusimicrobiota bacterium]
MFKKISLDKFYRLINHGPCVLITSGTKEKTNIAPIAWNMPLNDEPPLVAIAIAETHYTADLIIKSGELVINIADRNLLPFIKYCGEVSGRKIDKIKKMNIKLLKGVKINTPHLEKAAGFLECRIIDKKNYDGVILFIGKVIYAAVRSDIFDDYWLSDKAKIVHHLGGSYFACLGKRFKA